MRLKLYSTVEERFCPRVRENVVMETVHFTDGKVKETCLHQHSCQKKPDCEYTNGSNTQIK